MSKNRAARRAEAADPEPSRAELIERLDSCERLVEGLHLLLEEVLAPQLSETGLQILFVLRNLPIKRRKPGTSNLIVPGQPPEIELTTLYEVFQEQREDFIAKLEQEREAREQNLSQGSNGEAGHESRDAGAADPGKVPETKH